MEAKIKQVADDLNECRTEVGKEMVKLRSDLSDVRDDVAEILSIFKSSKGFFRVVGWIGKFIVWGSVIAGGIAAFLHLISTGEWHK